MSYPAEIKQSCYTNFGPYRRPFTPNPGWERADVMVVGTNPATPMRDEFESFEQYWKGLTKEPKLYWDRYHQVRSGDSSKSTNNANLLLDLLSPLNVLVTNVVWYPVKKKKEIPREEWNIGFDALMALYTYVQPKAVFCHGADAEKFARSIKPDVDRYTPAYEQSTSVIDGVLVQCFHHFSGQGLNQGSKFQPSTEFPIFAKSIRNHVRI